MPPLKAITLHSRPYAKRAIAWSCDGELAVAADDSFHIFVPEFPPPTGEDDDEAGRDPVTHDGASAGAASSQGQVPSSSSAFVPRPQFSQGARHLPVSYPPLSPHVNGHLFAAAGLPFPAARHTIAEVDLETGQERLVERVAADGEEANQPHGAGTGPISGVGSTLNHVVALGWSPSGLGRNRRPVLAVLTASGTLVLYGEGGSGGGADEDEDAAMPSPLGLGRQGIARDVQAWIVLWGVGERLMVPGQDEFGENIISFAWARAVAPGKALLAYLTDQKEVVILSVQSAFTQHTSRNGAAKALEASWLVREAARFMAAGPHPARGVTDPDYVPSGTSFGLCWSPWSGDAQASTSVLSYMDQNYIGFRRVNIKADLSAVEAETQDSDGLCLFLSTDAFVEWEDAVSSPFLFWLSLSMAETSVLLTDDSAMDCGRCDNVSRHHCQPFPAQALPGCSVSPAAAQEHRSSQHPRLRDDVSDRDRLRHESHTE